MAVFRSEPCNHEVLQTFNEANLNSLGTLTISSTLISTLNATDKDPPTQGRYFLSILSICLVLMFFLCLQLLFAVSLPRPDTKKGFCTPVGTLYVMKLKRNGKP